MPPRSPPVYRPPGWTERKPFANSRTAEKRLAGRALQRRNDRIKVRDQYTCQACGRVTTDGQVDHRIPLASNGPDTDDNCQWLCREPCHRDKSIRDRR